MAAVYELLPGDEVTLPGFPPAVFIDKTVHPLWRHMMLVIWQLDDGSWSLDTLAIGQEIGQVTPSDLASRTERLRRALTGPGEHRPEPHAIAMAAHPSGREMGAWESACRCGMTFVNLSEDNANNALQYHIEYPRQA